MHQLAQYHNGNCDVTLMSDGTKIIDFEEPAAPEYPMSIDLKITNRCDRACPWCHECSTPDGEHADGARIVRLLRDLPRGTELAIGGGDPMSHPALWSLLADLHGLGLIMNMTVNAAHADVYASSIQEYRCRGWLHGLGVSWNEKHLLDLAKVHDDNTVVHFIAGIHRPEHASLMQTTGAKILVMGYKTHGRGVAADQGAIGRNLDNWRNALPDLLKGGRVAFDTLALKQLEVKSHVTEAVWNRHFMGDDGQFTMYVDAAGWTFGKSSTARRQPLGRLGISKAFGCVRSDGA